MTSPAPKVSILIPVYNRDRLLGPCIDSALSQTFDDFEVVICDNASTDDTWSICQKYAEKDSRVRTFRNDTNLGPVENWRRCMEEARGELGKLLFSDDLIYPEFLGETVPFLADPDVGLVFTAAEMGPEIGRGVVVGEWRKAESVVSSRRFIRESLLSGRLHVSPGAALFRLKDLRRNLMNEIPSPSLSGFARTGAGPDLLCYLLAANAYRKVAHVSRDLCLFRAHPGSITIAAHGHLDDRYWQARLWFAATHTDRILYLRTKVSAWADMCRRSGMLLPYRESLEGFITDLPKPGILERLLVARRGFSILRKQKRNRRRASTLPSS